MTTIDQSHQRMTIRGQYQRTRSHEHRARALFVVMPLVATAGTRSNRGGELVLDSTLAFLHRGALALRRGVSGARNALCAFSCHFPSFWAWNGHGLESDLWLPGEPDLVMSYLCAARVAKVLGFPGEIHGRRTPNRAIFGECRNQSLRDVHWVRLWSVFGAATGRPFMPREHAKPR